MKTIQEMCKILEMEKAVSAELDTLLGECGYSRCPNTGQKADHLSGMERCKAGVEKSSGSG